MHELGIAEATLDAVRKESARYPNTRVVRVGLRIGELAGIDASALQFAFEAIVQGTEFETLHLEIEDWILWFGITIRNVPTVMDCTAAASAETN